MINLFNTGSLTINVDPILIIVKTINVLGYDIKVKEEWDLIKVPQKDHGILLQVIQKL